MHRSAARAHGCDYRGNHDWAAVGKIDLEEFSPAARISAQWTAETLTEEHRAFLENLPERLNIGECTLVHGSPYGPLWEYLTREDQALAERSFDYFTSRYCFVGHTHVPVIFQQPDVANAPTIPLGDTGEFEAILDFHANGLDAHLPGESDAEDDTTTEMAIALLPTQQLLAAQSSDDAAASAFIAPDDEQDEDRQAETLEDTPAPKQNPPEVPTAPIEDGNNTQDDGEGQGDRDEDQGDRKGRPYNTTRGTASEGHEEMDGPVFAEYGEESFAAAEPEAEQLALLEAENLPPEVHPVDEEHNESAGDAGGEDAREVAVENNDAGEDGNETSELALVDTGGVTDEQQDELMEHSTSMTI